MRGLSPAILAAVTLLLACNARSISPGDNSESAQESGTGESGSGESSEEAGGDGDGDGDAADLPADAGCMDSDQCEPDEVCVGFECETVADTEFELWVDDVNGGPFTYEYRVYLDEALVDVSPWHTPINGPLVWWSYLLPKSGEIWFEVYRTPLHDEADGEVVGTIVWPQGVPTETLHAGTFEGPYSPGAEGNVHVRFEALE